MRVIEEAVELKSLRAFGRARTGKRVGVGVRGRREEGGMDALKNKFKRAPVEFEPYEHEVHQRSREMRNSTRRGLSGSIEFVIGLHFFLISIQKDNKPK